jgi:hypothetical protein
VLSTDEDTAATIAPQNQLLLTTPTMDGDTLSVASVFRGRHGELQDGNVVFTPTASTA